MPKTLAGDLKRCSRGYDGASRRQDEVDDKKMWRAGLGSDEADILL